MSILRNSILIGTLVATGPAFACTRYHINVTIEKSMSYAACVAAIQDKNVRLNRALQQLRAEGCSAENTQSGSSDAKLFADCRRWENEKRAQAREEAAEREKEQKKAAAALLQEGLDLINQAVESPPAAPPPPSSQVQPQANPMAGAPVARSNRVV
jgi:hypothetical protein